MKQLLQHPYYFFWGLIPVILLIAFLLGDTAYYLNVYDLHLAVPYRELGFLVASVSFAIGAGYWMVLKRKRRLSPGLTAFHILITLVGPVGAMLAALLKRTISLPVTDILQYAADTQYNDRLLLASYGLWLVTILGQLVFPVNLWRALRRPAGQGTGSRTDSNQET